MPVSQGRRLSQEKLPTKAPVNGGSNLESPKVAKFLVGQVPTCMKGVMRPGEIVAVVKTPRTRSKTERPREPLLQAEIGQRSALCRIGGRLRRQSVSFAGVIVEIPP